MKLEKLLHSKNVQHVKNSSVICLHAKEYPLLFCREFIAYLGALEKCMIISSQMGSDNIGHSIASLNTSFLGQKSWYWLHSDRHLLKKAYDTWHHFLRHYTGPNTLIFFTDKLPTKLPSHWFVITLPDAINKTNFQLISAMLECTYRDSHSHIFKKVRTISLDRAVLLSNYLELIGKDTYAFFDTWFWDVVNADVSLFGLSQTLFERKARQFFSEWQQVNHLYAPQFWISFWSEQFWRAYHYVRLQKENKRLEAKKIGFRLPFSFLNTDWRNCSLNELQRAHNQLYTIDYHLKQGGNQMGLEILYAQFLNGSI